MALRCLPRPAPGAERGEAPGAAPRQVARHRGALLPGDVEDQVGVPGVHVVLGVDRPAPLTDAQQRRGDVGRDVWSILRDR